MKPAVPDVLATRYASPQLVALWAPAAKVVLERRLWLPVREHYAWDRIARECGPAVRCRRTPSATQENAADPGLAVIQRLPSEA